MHKKSRIWRHPLYGYSGYVTVWSAFRHISNCRNIAHIFLFNCSGIYVRNRRESYIRLKLECNTHSQSLSINTTWTEYIPGPTYLSFKMSCLSQVLNFLSLQTARTFVICSWYKYVYKRIISLYSLVSSGFSSSSIARFYYTFKLSRVCYIGNTSCCLVFCS